MRILCVCSAGRNRSRYLADHLHTVGHETDFAGAHPLSLNRVSQHRIDWADVVIAVRPWIAERLRGEFKMKRVITLDIPNDPGCYERMVREAAERI